MTLLTILRPMYDDWQTQVSVQVPIGIRPKLPRHEREILIYTPVEGQVLLHNIAWEDIDGIVKPKKFRELMSLAMVMDEDDPDFSEEVMLILAYQYARLNIKN